MALYQRGDTLPEALQRVALATYVHRFTCDHVPAWARQPMPSGRAYPVQFASDREWLARTLFPVTKGGKIGQGNCFASPSWPDGTPEGQREPQPVPASMED